MIARIVGALVALVLIPLLASADDHELKAKARAKATALFSLRDGGAKAAGCTCVSGTGVCDCVECDCAIGSDYDAACAVAKRTGKPLLVYLTTDACFWCAKLEAGPLKACPAGLVCVKLHESKSAWGKKVAETVLARHEPVEVRRGNRTVKEILPVLYPCLVLAAPDGTILKTHEGYLEADKLADWIGRKASLPRASMTTVLHVAGS